MAIVYSIGRIWDVFRNPNRKPVKATHAPRPEQLAVFTLDDQALIDSATIDTSTRNLYHRMVEYWKGELTEESFQNWIEPLQVAGCIGKKVILTAPTRAIKVCVEDEYHSEIREMMGGSVSILAPS